MKINHIPSVCCFCGCGCGLYFHVLDGQITGVSPSRTHPVSKGNLCVKGWHVHDFIYSPNRLLHPLVRKNGKLVPASWDEALSRACEAFTRVLNEHGGKGIGILSSAKCTNEENYLVQKLARAVFKTNNVDHCARL